MPTSSDSPDLDAALAARERELAAGPPDPADAAGEGDHAACPDCGSDAWSSFNDDCADCGLDLATPERRVKFLALPPRFQVSYGDLSGVTTDDRRTRTLRAARAAARREQADDRRRHVTSRWVVYDLEDPERGNLGLDDVDDDEEE
jgi:hypothetical protein